MSDRWQLSDPLGAGLPRCLQESPEFLCQKLHVSRGSGTLGKLIRRKFFRDAVRKLSNPPRGNGKAKRALVALYGDPAFRRQRWLASFESSRNRKIPKYSLERNLLQEWSDHADQVPADRGPDALPDREALERLAGPNRVLEPEEAINWVAATCEELRRSLEAWEDLADEVQEATVLALFAVATVLDSQQLLRDAADRIPRLADEYEGILKDSPSPLERGQSLWLGTCRRLLDVLNDMVAADAETVAGEQFAALRGLVEELEELRSRLSEEAARFELGFLRPTVEQMLSVAEQHEIIGPDGAADLRDRWAEMDARVGVEELRAEQKRLGEVRLRLVCIQEQREKARDIARQRAEVSRRLASDDPPAGAEFQRLLEEDDRYSNELREAAEDYSHYLSGLSEDLYPQISIPEMSETPDAAGDEAPCASVTTAPNGGAEVGCGAEASDLGDDAAAARDEWRGRERQLRAELQRVKDERAREVDALKREVDDLKREADARRQDQRAADERVHRLEQALDSNGSEASDPTPDWPQKWEAFMPWCNDHLSGNVVLAPPARKSIKKALYKEVEIAARCLLWLADDARKRRGGDAAAPRRDHELPHGIYREPCGGDTFAFRFDGRTVEADWHLKCGGNTRDPSRCLRIYYCWADDSRKYVVADMPAHRHHGNS